MSTSNLQIIESCIVEDDVQMSITELCHTTNADSELVIAWVYEGILTPQGNTPEDWRFSGDALQRAKKALVLARDLEINAPGVAMVLDLLDEISKLKR